MPEEQAPETFGSQPCVLIFSPFPYSRFWGCRVIEPVYPDDTGEVTKRSHQLARATSAVPWEAFSLQGVICLRKCSERSSTGPSARLTLRLCQSPLSKALNWSLISPVSSWGWAERTCPHKQWPVSSLERTEIFFPQGLNCRWLRLGWNLSWSHPNL